MVVATGDDEATGICLIGGDDAHAGHEVGVAVHTVHLRVAPVLTTQGENTGKKTSWFASFLFHTTPTSQQGSCLLFFFGLRENPEHFDFSLPS